MAPTWPAEKCSVSASVSRDPIVPTIVTSSPSRTQVMPSANTIVQCHLDHGNRSSRAGMKPNHTVARDHCLAPARASRAALAGARYGRLFPEPPPLDLRPDQLRALGRRGGLCEPSDGFAYAREVAAGWPIFGQYIAHDLTADRSALTMRADVDALVNFHSPRANLECLYGDGPSAQPSCTATPTARSSC